MNVEYRFLEPLDVLFLRGNKLFGEPGSYGESLIPPWPSVAAGAIRSRMLADVRADMGDYTTWPKELGTPDKPGPFTVAAFQLARRHGDGKVEALFQMPADLVVSESADGTVAVRALTPIPLTPAPLPEGEGIKTVAPEGIQSSAPLPLLPVLANTERSKPASGYWLTESGWTKYLAGQAPAANDLVKSGALWQIDPRIGVGLDADKRRAADGRLFTVQAVAMVKQDNRIRADKATGKPILSEYDIGFLAVVTGAVPPTSGTIRLGGDGRAAAIQPVNATLPEPDYEAMARARRCRLVLATPGIFGSPRPSGEEAGERAGWLPNGFSPLLPGEEPGVRETRFDLHGVKGRLVCAAVPRAEVVSGWDLANRKPKPALRAAPTGSVYWLEDLEATPEALRKLVAQGLWSEPCEDSARRAEGFNRIHLAAY